MFDFFGRQPANSGMDFGGGTSPGLLGGGGMDPRMLGLLNAGASMLQASGPSTTPKSLGQIAGSGLMGGLQGFGMGKQFEAMDQRSAMHKAQMEELARKTKAGEEQAARIAAFGASLPEAERAAFMANPNAYLEAFYKEKLDTKPLIVPPGAAVMPRGASAPTFTAPFKPEEAKPSPLAALLKERDALPPNSPIRATYDEAIKRATAMPQPAVVVDNRAGRGLADNVKDIVAGTHAAASSAVDSLGTIGNIEKALSSGNINLGPGATVRTKVDQVAQWMGVGGKDTEERLINTRNVIRGLAQSTVNARKALKGQGQVSDYEGRLLMRAEAGEIDDFTVPELKDFLKVSRRMAEKAYGEHKRILGVMSKDEASKGLIPFYEVPAPGTTGGFELSPEGAAALRKYGGG
jgi:hypothetical protein